MKLTIKLDLYMEITVPEKSDRSLFSAIVSDNQVGLEDFLAKKLNSFIVKEIPPSLENQLSKAGVKDYSFISKRQLLAGK
jgi:hypothetical protein